jgi:hypothetical protein
VRQVASRRKGDQDDVASLRPSKAVSCRAESDAVMPRRGEELCRPGQIQDQSVDQSQFSAGSMSRGVVVRFVTAANYGVCRASSGMGCVECSATGSSLALGSLMSFV